MDLFFVNGVLAESADAKTAISFNDRALQYGDGVFETLRIFQGEIPMWGFHQQRLENAQEILKLPIDGFLSGWEIFIAQHLSSIDNACAKLVISRGEGPRGYKIPQQSPEDSQSTLNWWLKVTDLPNTKNKELFNLTLCRHALSRQPALAGLKHLNRLDQVLARSEWDDQDNFDEGIMFNIDGDVIEGTMSNIFWLKGEQLYTPDLTQEGVDGCVRRWILNKQSHELPVVITKNTKLDQLLTADAVFLTNSLMGIQKVGRIDNEIIEQSASIDQLAADFNQQFIL